MTYAIDAPTLEAAIVRHCSPTLAALKPASLFTFPGRFVAERTQEREEVAARRRALLHLIAACSAELRESDISIRILAWRSCGALVYVYRPCAVAARVGEERVREHLRALGYDTADLEGCLAMLGGRLAAAGTGAGEPAAPPNGSGLPAEFEAAGVAAPASAAPGTAETPGAAASPHAHGAARACPCVPNGCTRAFPHEIGFFLGYPYADVAGFIEHGGHDYLASGLWKVYGDRDEALATFARYRRCTSAFEGAYRRGGKLSQLAVRSR